MTSNATLPNSSAGESTSTNAYSPHDKAQQQQQQPPQWPQLDATTQAWLAAQQIHHNNASSIGLPASTASAQVQALRAIVGQGVQQPFLAGGGSGGQGGQGPQPSLPMPSLSLSGLNPAGHQAALQALLSGAAAGKLNDAALAAAFAAAGGAPSSQATTTDQATLAATRPLANSQSHPKKTSTFFPSHPLLSLVTVHRGLAGEDGRVASALLTSASIRAHSSCRPGQPVDPESRSRFHQHPHSDPVDVSAQQQSATAAAPAQPVPVHQH